MKLSNGKPDLVKMIKEKILVSKVDLYKDEIEVRNYNSFVGFSIVGTFISISVVLVGQILSNIVTFNTEFLIIFLYFIFLIILAKSYLYKHMNYITLSFYLALTPLMIMGILMGTFLDRSEPSITIMVFICVLTLFILDKPWRIILYITCIAVLYGVCCYKAKTYEMFIADFIDLLAFYCLGIGVNIFILNDRIDCVENFVKYRNKSEIDLMTGFYNRSVGKDKIMQLLDQKVYGAFIIIDIDNLKQVNDKYGHMCGDHVIRKSTSVIRNCFSKNDIFLRLGGDEFIVYSVGLVDQKQCKMRLEQLLKELREYKIGNIKEIALSASLGCSIFDKSTLHYEQLYKNSDKCLYEAKNAGKGCYVVHSL